MKLNLRGCWYIAAVVCFLFFGHVFGNFGNEQTDSGRLESFSSTAAERDALKEWFSTQLGLDTEATRNVDIGTRKKSRATRAHTPQYVQNLYDRMALEIDEEDQGIGRRRRSINGASYNFGAAESVADTSEGPVTIQAVGKDDNLVWDTGAGRGYLLPFNFSRLWMPDQQLELAELVLAVDYSRLIGPPGSYSVYAYSVDTDVASASRSRLLVSAGSLGILDTFRDNFIKLKVTDSVVRKLVDGGPRSILLEVFVAYNGPDDGGGNAELKYDLNLQDIGNLFHLSSSGIHQPLLVLYSAKAKGIGEGSGSVYQTRRRRSVPNSTQPQGDWRHPDTECGRREWWVDLLGIFKDQLIAPDGFYANFCGGACHHPMLHSRWNATGNAHLRCRYCHNQPQTGSGQPCDLPEPTCVPQSLSPITVVYQVNAHYIIRRLEDIVVNTCMCA